MLRYLFGRIAASISTRTGWKRAAAARDAGARDTGTMGAYRPAGGAGLDAGEDAPGSRVSPDDLLARAMVSIGLDFTRCEGLLLHEMRLVCRSCNARGRCRRDLGTGDFARRYRHYCPNAESLALLVAAEHSRSDGTPRQEH